MLAATLHRHNWSTLSKKIDTDTELIRAVARKDKVAFEQLYRLYHPRIYKFSMRMLKDHMQAEEVASDTLYAVWGGADRFREQSAVSSWILGIAYKRAIKSYKRNVRHTDNREPEHAMEALVETFPGVDPEAQTSNAMAVDSVQQALSSLSSNHRAVIELTALGYSVSEIAGIVECPENTVKTRTFHARRQLKDAMQD
jgi:RNA polymerase sigma-70 factor (ECF subfamily)